MAETFELEDYEVWQAPDCASARARLAMANPDAIMLDLQLPDGDGMDLLPWILREHPGIPVVIGTSHATYEKAVKAIRLGAYDFVEKTVDREQLLLPIRNAVEKRKLERVQAALRRELRGDQYLIAESKAMKALLAEVDKVAKLDEKVLLLGETGVGKEMVADYIQAQSDRAGEPYVKINCGAIPTTLVESELFGSDRGAYTGAYERRYGVFQAADGGTLLLDEIGELTMEAQSRFLRVLQHGEIKLLGNTNTIKVDVRVIAATNQDLNAMVEQGRFRGDLLARLRTFVYKIPPFRDRPEDVLALMEYELQRAAKKFNKPALKLTSEARVVIQSFNWPDNARSIKTMAKRLTVYFDGTEVTSTDLVRYLDEPEEVNNHYKSAKLNWERSFLEKLLRATGGNRAKAAQIAEIDPKTLYTKLRDHSLEDFSPD